MKRWTLAAVLSLLAGAACLPPLAGGVKGLTDLIEADVVITVYLTTVAMATVFMKTIPDAHITLGIAYYEGNKKALNVVAVATKEGADYVLPTPENILSKKYAPLSRPLFIYVRNDSLKRPEVAQFVQFYMRRNDLVEASKYVPLST